MRMISTIGAVMALMLGVAPALGGAFSLSQSFTYQGRLVLDGEPVNSTANFEFSLWDSAVGGAQVGVTDAVNNVAVSDGLFTAQISFGVDAFNGSHRWLQIAVCTPGGCGEFTTLSPRQSITATPYALQTRGLFVNSASQVGVNTETPLSRFTVNGDVTLTTDGDSIRFPDTEGANTPMIQMFTLSTTNGNRMVMGHSPDFPTWGLEYVDSVDQFRFRRDTGSVLTVDLLSRFVGVRNNDPQVPLHVDGGTDAGPAGGGFLAVGNTSAANVVLDNNEVMARNNGAVAPLSLNASGGDIYMMQLGAGNVGIGTSAPDATLHVAFGQDASLAGGGFLLAGPPAGLNLVIDNNEIMARNNGGAATLALNAQGGTVTTGGSLDVGGNLVVGNIDVAGTIDVGTAVYGGFLMARTSNSHAANVWRDGSDGPLIFFFNDDTDIGSISMSGQNVSYNAFTGSHFAWIDQTLSASIEPGTLMRLTGVNRRHANRGGAEIVYGVATTSTANDPACLGAYFSVHDAEQPFSHDNPHLVAAVGNADMWVTDDDRGNIQPGDYLVSSNVPGCAMKDDPTRFLIGHVVARAGEALDWSSIEPDASGVRRARISVLFESFVRHGDANAIAQQLDDQQRRIQDLEAQVRSLQQAAAQLSSLQDMMVQLEKSLALVRAEGITPEATAVEEIGKR